MINVLVYNIVYFNNESILSVCGLDALRNFADGIIDKYDAKSAPKSYQLTIDIDENNPNFITELYKIVEEKAQLKVQRLQYVIVD